jgi:hypothetical protein
MPGYPLIPDWFLSITEAEKKMHEFETMHFMLTSALTATYNPVMNTRYIGYLRPNEQYTEYQRQENSVRRPADKDRVFPLETLSLQQFNREHETDLNKAVIHTGPYADEYARSFNALALTIGYNIFFRNNAFNRESEEGRKTLAHELTHVAQYDEGKINGNKSVEELEDEADSLAAQEEYTDNPCFLIRLNNKTYRIKKLEIDKIADQIAQNIDNKIREQQNFMDEESYFKLLVEYKTMLKEEAGYGIFDAL